MEELRVMEKPDWVSWEDVRKCIYRAQQTNVKKGFDMAFGHLSAEELCEKIGDGYCFVVLNEQNNVIGTVTLKVSNIDYWWYKGEAGYHCYEGIVPEYRGTDVYFDMHAALMAKEKELGIKLLWGDTAEHNSVVLKSVKKKGWKHVQYKAYRSCDYYSVIFAKWMDGCPYSDETIDFMFKLSRRFVRFVYKPRHVNRFISWMRR